MNMQMRYFSSRPMTSVHLSYDITGSIAKCHKDSLGMKLVNYRLLTIVLSFKCFPNERFGTHKNVSLGCKIEQSSSRGNWFRWTY